MNLPLVDCGPLIRIYLDSDFAAAAGTEEEMPQKPISSTIAAPRSVPAVVEASTPAQANGESSSVLAISVAPVPQ